MRQLVGFVAYLITGGQSATERVRAGQDTLGFAYSNLAFEGGVGPLFDAVRDGLRSGRGHPPGLGRPALARRHRRSRLAGQAAAGADDAQRVRAQHRVPGDQAAILLRAQGRHRPARAGARRTSGSSRRRCASGEEATATVVRDLVLALNRFFEPDCPDTDKDHVQLWQSHRYDVRAPSTFVSFHALSYQHLRIEPLKTAPWVEAWLPEEQLDRRSFALVATWEDSDVAVVEIDRELFLTLIEAERGLGPVELVADGDPADHPLHRPDPRLGRAGVADRGHPHPQRRERPRRAVRDPARAGEVPAVTPIGHEGAAGVGLSTRSSDSGSPTSRSSRSTSPTASPGR